MVPNLGGERSVDKAFRRENVLVPVGPNRVAAADDPSVASNPRWVFDLTGARVLGPTPFVADAVSRPRFLAPFVDSLVGGR